VRKLLICEATTTHLIYRDKLFQSVGFCARRATGRFSNNIYLKNIISSIRAAVADAAEKIGPIKS
jgi:hypothetical protein